MLDGGDELEDGLGLVGEGAVDLGGGEWFVRGGNGSDSRRNNFLGRWSMKLSKSHLDMISGSAPGELEVVLHPTKPLIIIEVVGTAVLMTMDPKQVEVLEKRLAQVRGMLRDKALVEKSTPSTVGQ